MAYYETKIRQEVIISWKVLGSVQLFDTPGSTEDIRFPVWVSGDDEMWVNSNFIYITKEQSYTIILKLEFDLRIQS